MKNTGEVLKNKLLADLILATAALVLIADIDGNGLPIL